MLTETNKLLVAKMSMVKEKSNLQCKEFIVAENRSMPTAVDVDRNIK